MGEPGAPHRTAPTLLAATGPLLLSPLGWVLDAIADAGFTAAEVLLAHNPETRDPEKVLAYAEEAGLAIPVVHGPYMVVLRTVLGTSYVAKSRTALELASAMGAETMVAHAPLRWERGGRAWIASGEMDAEAAEHGVRFAMENLYPVLGRSISTVVTPEDFAPFDSIVFDTSHFAVAGIDIFEAWQALSDRVVHLHVSDNFGNGKDSHAPIGSGVLPLEEFLATVGASGYAGTITLELDVRAYLDTRESFVAFLARERVKAEALLRGEGAAPRLLTPEGSTAPSDVAEATR
jgi:sugar phosphate isomerase/epimerase